MKNLKRLGAVIALTSVLGVPALAGQILTPCPPPEPGQILTPCDPGSAPSDLGASAGASATAGSMGTPTVAGSETSLTEIAANVLSTFLPLY